MDLTQLANTFLLVNMRSDSVNYSSVLLSLSVIYIIRYYREIYEYLLNWYHKKIYNKCSINLEMKVQSLTSNMRPSFNLSYKVLGILFKLNQMKLNVDYYEEVQADIDLEAIDDNKVKEYPNHLIPIMSNFKYNDDIYITSFIKSQQLIDSNRSTNHSQDKNMHDALEYKIIYINISCYNHNMNYIKQFVEECEKDYIVFLNRNNNKRMIITSSYYIDEETKRLKFNKYDFSSNKNFDNLFFEGKEIIIKRIDNYLNNIEKYQRLGIPHTLGFLFHGQVGAGKTSTIKAIANYTNRSLISINMNYVECVDDLIKLFNSPFITHNHIPLNKRIYVFEEIDCCDSFLSREELDKKIKQEDINNTKDTKNTELISDLMTNKWKKQKNNPNKITIGQLLEVLDGIIECEDRICVFTTNYIEKIDKALLRPGRIDLVVDFKKLRRVDLQNLFQVWFNQKIPEKDLSDIKDYSITQAEFGKICFENLDSPVKVIANLIKSQN